MNEMIIKKLLTAIYKFYPGLAGEDGQAIFSLGDYSKESIDRFICLLRRYKGLLSENYECNYLIIKQIEARIYELENTYKSQSYFYYGRSFLTLFESLSTTQDNSCNKQLFIKRQDYLEDIISQATINLDNKMLSRIEILLTRKQFDNTCKKIEFSAADLINEKYYSAKMRFDNLLVQKLDQAGTIVPKISRDYFIDFVEGLCDHIYSINIIEQTSYELLKELNGHVSHKPSKSIPVSQETMTKEYISSLVNSIEKFFSIPDALSKKKDLSSLIVSDSHPKQLTQNYRAIIGFTHEDKVLLHINTKYVNDEDQLVDTLIHEIFPGHYFMFLFYPDYINRYFKDISFWEGWALFCEYYSLSKYNSSSYRSKISVKLSHELLIGLICIRIWCRQQSKEEIIAWLQNEMKQQEEDCHRLFITSLSQYEDRLPYFVGFLAMYLLYKDKGFNKLIRLVMNAGATFYHINIIDR